MSFMHLIYLICKLLRTLHTYLMLGHNLYIDLIEHKNYESKEMYLPLKTRKRTLFSGAVKVIEELMQVGILYWATEASRDEEIHESVKQFLFSHLISREQEITKKKSAKEATWNKDPCYFFQTIQKQRLRDSSFLWAL